MAEGIKVEKCVECLAVARSPSGGAPGSVSPSTPSPRLREPKVVDGESDPTHLSIILSHGSIPGPLTSLTVTGVAPH